MPDNIESQFDPMTDDVFDQLMDTVPQGTANADTLVGGTKPADKPKEDPKDEPKKEGKDKEAKDKPEEKTKSQEDIDKELELATDDGEAGEAVVTNDATAEILKAKAQGLIERGIWRSFEGMENFEWTDENYGELATAQATWTAQEVFEEMLDKTGEYGKAIFNHIKNGGNPEEIVDLFKEAKRIESYDITTEAGQEFLVKEYHKNVLKWSDTKIKRFIDNAIDNKSLEDEAKEVKTLLDAQVKEQIQATQKAQAEYEQQQRELQQQWAENIGNTIKGREDLTDKEKKEISTSLLQYNQKLGDGRQVNQFTLDFMKLQADPQRYIDLVLFVRNPDKYMQRIAKEEKTKAAKQAWNFVKGNGALTKNTGTSHSTTVEDKKTELKINWKDLYK